MFGDQRAVYFAAATMKSTAALTSASDSNALPPLGPRGPRSSRRSPRTSRPTCACSRSPRPMSRTRRSAICSPACRGDPLGPRRHAHLAPTADSRRHPGRLHHETYARHTTPDRHGPRVWPRSAPNGRLSPLSSLRDSARSTLANCRQLVFCPPLGVWGPQPTDRQRADLQASGGRSGSASPFLIAPMG